MANVIKFQAPFERLKLYNSSSEVNLRKAIITQAIIDATNVSNNPEAKKWELEAKTWIFGNDIDFHQICLDSGIEPSFVVKITKEIIKLHQVQSKIKERVKSSTNLKKPSRKLNDFTEKNSPLPHLFMEI